jgi:type II secretory ATPase GspE/PulE/Tfp pilus assembly ATPase PilB-like protein
MPPGEAALEGADPSALKEVSAKVATHYHLMPVGWDGGALQVAMARAPSLEVLDELRVVLKRDVSVVLAGEKDIEKAIKAHYGIGADTLERLGDGPAPQLKEAAPADHDLDEARDASVVKLVNQILKEAALRRATDIHLEPYADELRVRYRIDGVLYDAKMSDPLTRFQAAVISRIKIMADLSIAEKRLPQDGRIKVRVEGRELDMRVSTLPTPFGEGVVIRLLTSRQQLDLVNLGFAQEDLSRLESFLAKPHGIVFLTGPTGSGKTTTLYAFLRRINTADKKILTLEDPIEYQMKGVTQVQVNPKVGLTFAAGLRSMLRHDPDVMMVGEVRDLETAEIAIRVALTGHLVFSTLHTNDAAGAVTRLQDIGLEPYLVSSSVVCLIAQRLVRLICPECRRERKMTPEIAAEFSLSPEEVRKASLSEGAGCDACQGTGFRGRTVIYEILPMTHEIRALVASRAPADVIRDKAVEQGMRPLRRCGWEKVARGLTAPEEVIRATLSGEA